MYMMLLEYNGTQRKYFFKLDESGVSRGSYGFDIVTYVMTFDGFVHNENYGGWIKGRYETEQEAQEALRLHMECQYNNWPYDVKGRVVKCVETSLES